MLYEWTVVCFVIPALWQAFFKIFWILLFEYRPPDCPSNKYFLGLWASNLDCLIVMRPRVLSMSWSFKWIASLIRNPAEYTFVAFYLKTPIHFFNLKLFVAIRRSLNVVAQREKNNFLFNYDAFIFVCVDECVVIWKWFPKSVDKNELNLFWIKS